MDISLAWIRAQPTPKKQERKSEFPKRDTSAEREPTFLAESSKEFFTAEPSHLSIFTGLSSIFHCNGNSVEWGEFHPSAFVPAVSTKTKQKAAAFLGKPGWTEGICTQKLPEQYCARFWAGFSSYTLSQVWSGPESRFHFASAFAAPAAVPRKWQLSWIPAFGCIPTFQPHCWKHTPATDSWGMEENFKNPQLSLYKGRIKRHKQEISGKPFCRTKGKNSVAAIFKSSAGMGPSPVTIPIYNGSAFPRGPPSPEPHYFLVTCQSEPWAP